MRRVMLVTAAVTLTASIAFWANREAKIVTFDPVLWADETRYYDPPHPRLAMARSVLQDELFVGQTKEAVIARLGPPSDTPYFQGQGLVYWLGPEGGMGVDSRWLVIGLDSAETVIDFALRSD